MKFTYSPLITIQRWWLFLFIVAIPFSTAYITNSSAAISYINIFSIVFILLGLLTLALKETPFVWVKDKQTLGVIGLLMLAMFYALFFTHPLRDGVGLWTSRLLQPLLVGFFVYQMLEAKFLKVEELGKVFLLSLIPLIIGGFMQFTGIIPYRDGMHRITILYRWPNTFARYVEILLLVSLPYIWFKLEKYRTWAFVVWISGLALLLGTISYNAVATSLVAFIVFLLLLPKAYKKIKISLLTAIIIILGIGALNTSHIPKWQISLNDSRVTREEFWGIAIGAIKDHPLTGIGIKGWESQYPQLLEKYDTGLHLNYSSEQPHNIFLDSMLKAGPLGLIAVVLLLLWPIWRGYTLFKDSDLTKDGWFGLSLILYGLAMFLFGFIDDPLWSDDIMPLLYILLMTAAYLYAQKKIKSNKVIKNS